MIKISERDTLQAGDVIDLGAVTTETRGGSQFDPPDGVQLQRKDIPTIAED